MRKDIIVSFQVLGIKLLTVMKTITGEPPVDLRLKEADRMVGSNKSHVYTPAAGKKYCAAKSSIFPWDAAWAGIRLKSANFIFNKNGNTWEFTGKGLAHGVGLYQFGAWTLTQSGKITGKSWPSIFPAP